METNDNIIDVSYVDTYVFKKEDYKFIKEFTYRETIDHIYLKSYIGTSSEVVIPDTFKDKPITFVDKGFFDECKVPITSLSLGDNLISFSAKIKNIKTLNKIAAFIIVFSVGFILCLPIFNKDANIGFFYSAIIFILLLIPFLINISFNFILLTSFLSNAYKHYIS